MSFLFSSGLFMFPHVSLCLLMSLSFTFISVYIFRFGCRGRGMGLKGQWGKGAWGEMGVLGGGGELHREREAVGEGAWGGVMKE